MSAGGRRAALAVLVAGSVAVGLAAAGAAAAVGAPAVVSAADDDRLLLSGDGSTWAPDLTTPLLDPDLVWVPGDVVTGRLYARNASGERATAAATVRLSGGPDGARDPLVDALNLRTRIGSGPWTDGPRSRGAELSPGEELPIDVEVELDPAATDVTQLRAARVDVVVTLSGVGSGGSGPGPGGGGTGVGGAGAGGAGGLAPTGADLLLPALVAAGAVVLGVVLRRRARRG
jgi:hypothetical protein